MNPLYQQMMGSMQVSPIQQAMQAMQNPAAFVRSRFPDIPEQIANDPNQILQYLQQTRGIPNQRIQQLMSMFGNK